MSYEEHHRRGIESFRQGKTEDAVNSFAMALRERETAEAWNDWATAQFALNRTTEAERGFRKGLVLEPRNYQAALNLGVLLAGQTRYAEAEPWLELGAVGVSVEQREAAQKILSGVRDALGNSNGRGAALVASAPASTKQRRNWADKVPAGLGLRPVRRMVLTSDITRPEKAQFGHKHLESLLGWSLKQAVRGLEMAPVAWEERPGALDGKRLHRWCGLPEGHQHWAALVDTEDIPDEAARYLDEFFDGSVVVGFEMSKLLLGYLIARGIPYVNLALHPVRFMDDVFFGVCTNIPNAFEALKKYAMAEEEFYLQAQVHKATLTRLGGPELRPNSCVFAGQTSADKSLVQDGKVLTADDFREELLERTKGYSRVYYKRHPYARNDAEILERMKATGRVEVITHNIYALMCHPAIEEIFSISSGVLVEAKYFGKKATRLARPKDRFYGPGNTEFDPLLLAPVYDAWYSPHFWSEMLGSVCEVRACADLRPARRASRLRTTFNAFWGYNYLDAEVMLNSLRATGYSFYEPPAVPAPAPVQEAPPPPPPPPAPIVVGGWQAVDSEVLRAILGTMMRHADAFERITERLGVLESIAQHLGRQMQAGQLEPVVRTRGQG